MARQIHDGGLSATKPGGRLSQFIRTLVCSTLVLATACGSSLPKRAYQSPWVLKPTDTVNVSIESGAPSPTDPRRPIAGSAEGAAINARRVSGGIIEVGFSDGCDLGGCLVSIPLALVAAPFAALYGASASHSKEQVEATVAKIRNTVNRSRPWEDLEAGLIGNGRISDDGPFIKRGKSGRNRLILEIVGFSLMTPGSDFNPDVVVVLQVSGRIEQSGRGAPVTLRWTESSVPMGFFEIGTSREAILDKAIRDTAQSIGVAIRKELAHSVSR